MLPPTITSPIRTNWQLGGLRPAAGCAKLDTQQQPPTKGTSMARSNKSTEAQRRFIAALAARSTDERVNAAAKAAARMNSNRGWEVGNRAETLNQFTKRLTKAAASRMIDELKA